MGGDVKKQVVVAADEEKTLESVERGERDGIADSDNFLSARRQTNGRTNDERCILFVVAATAAKVEIEAVLVSCKT